MEIATFQLEQLHQPISTTQICETLAIRYVSWDFFQNMIHNCPNATNHEASFCQHARLGSQYHIAHYVNPIQCSIPSDPVELAEVFTEIIEGATLLPFSIANDVCALWLKQFFPSPIEMQEMIHQLLSGIAHTPRLEPLFKFLFIDRKCVCTLMTIAELTVGNCLDIVYHLIDKQQFVDNPNDNIVQLLAEMEMFHGAFVVNFLLAKRYAAVKITRACVDQAILCQSTDSFSNWAALLPILFPSFPQPESDEQLAISRQLFKPFLHTSCARCVRECLFLQQQ
jgi:hypothetical protein